jgi:hypothetical protein
LFKISDTDVDDELDDIESCIPGALPIGTLGGEYFGRVNVLLGELIINFDGRLESGTDNVLLCSTFSILPLLSLVAFVV